VEADGCGLHLQTDDMGAVQMPMQREGGDECAPEGERANIAKKWKVDRAYAPHPANTLRQSPFQLLFGSLRIARACTSVERYM
jgi:hypothetical protein